MGNIRRRDLREIGVVASALMGIIYSDGCRNEGDLDASAMGEVRVRGRRWRKGEGEDRKSLFGSEGVAKYYSKTEIWTHALPLGLPIIVIHSSTALTARPTKKPLRFPILPLPPRFRRCRACLGLDFNASQRNSDRELAANK